MTCPYAMFVRNSKRVIHFGVFAILRALPLFNVLIPKPSRIHKTTGNFFQLEGIIIAQSLVDEAELLFVFVRKVSRRSGLGGVLLNNTLKHLASTGTIDVFLEVARSNRAAALLYEKNFFRPVGIRTNYYKRGRAGSEDAIVYRRTFSS